MLPLQPRGKLPLTEHGSRDASADAATITTWWERWPDANVGIATGGRLLVVDLDGADGIAAWAELERQHGAAPTLTSRTGSGGLHLLYESARELPNSAKRLGPSIDTRGRGGYIVAPPSVHPSGSVYRWENRLPIAPVPAFVVELLVPPRPAAAPAPARRVAGDGSAYGLAALRAEAERVASTGPGARNATLNEAAFALGRLQAGGELPLGIVAERGATLSGLVETELLAAALTCGLPEREARQTIASGVLAGRRHPRQAPRRDEPEVIVAL